MSTLPNAGPEDSSVLTPVQQKVAALLSAGSTIAAARFAGIHSNTDSSEGPQLSEPGVIANTVANWRRHPAVQAASDQATRTKGNQWREPTGALTLLKAAVAILERQGRSPDVVQLVHNPAQPDPPATKMSRTNPIQPIDPGPQTLVISSPPPGEPVHPAHNPAQPGPPAAKMTGTNPIQPIDPGPKTLVTSSPQPCDPVHPAHNPAQPGPPAAKMTGTNPIQPIDPGPQTLVISSPPPGEPVQPMHNPAQAPKTDRTNPISPSAGRPKTGRNRPCPCGSGKKFKRCCLTTGVSK